MTILNVGAGAMRLPRPFINLDNLREQLAVGTRERHMLDLEENYVEHTIGSSPLPFPDNSFTAVALFHCLEHFEAQEGLSLLKDILRVLEPGGRILVSVPDASYFRKVFQEDRNENWPRLFDVSDPPNPIPTWHEAALWFDQHRVILTEDAVWSYLTMAGYMGIERLDSFTLETDDDALRAMHKELNRRIFSLVMKATKP